MSAAKRVKKSFSTAQLEELITEKEINEFKIDLNEFKSKFEKLEFDLKDNCTDFISDECSELRRLIQLNKEEVIVSFKQANDIDINTDDLEPEFQIKINEIDNQCETMLTQVDSYEKETIDFYITNKPIKKNLKKDYNKLKTIANFFVPHWIECSQETDLNYNKLTEAVTKLKEYQLRLEEMIDKAKLFYFNNNLLTLKQFDEPKQHEMSFYIYFKKIHNLDKSKGHSLKMVQTEIVKRFQNDNKNRRSVDFRCELLANGTFLITSKVTTYYWSSVNSDQISSKYWGPIFSLIKFDPILNRIENETSNEMVEITNLVVKNNLIVLICTHLDQNINNERILVIMNENLEIIKQIECGYLQIIGVTESHICCKMDEADVIQVYNWSLEKVNVINLQKSDQSKPFYFRHYFIKYFMFIKNRYFVKLFSDNSLTMFNEQGIMVKSINIPEILDIRVDSKNNLFVFNGSKLFFYDLNFMPVKEISLIGIGRHNIFRSPLNLLIDKNDNIKFLDKMNLFIHD